MKKKYQWVRSIPDIHDYRVSFVNQSEVLPSWIPVQSDVSNGILKIATSIDTFPKSVDLRKYCSPIMDQGDLGSCVSNVVTSYMEYLENKNHVHSFSFLSRLFAYYNGRWIEDDINNDDGAEIRDVLKSIVKWGICDERLFPYDIKTFTQHPKNEAYLDALRNKIKVYARIEQNINDIKMCLANELPVIFGFTCYTGFENIGNDGILKMPTRDERLFGGHAVMAVGFDDSTQMIIARNSWGIDWGMKGYFFVPYKYIINRDLADDFWVIQK